MNYNYTNATITTKQEEKIDKIINNFSSKLEKKY
jgi:hypothetical protein